MICQAYEANSQTTLSKSKFFFNNNNNNPNVAEGNRLTLIARTNTYNDVFHLKASRNYPWKTMHNDTEPKRKTKKLVSSHSCSRGTSTRGMVSSTSISSVEFNLINYPWPPKPKPQTKPRIVCLHLNPCTVLWKTCMSKEILRTLQFQEIYSSWLVCYFSPWEPLRIEAGVCTVRTWKTHPYDVIVVLLLFAMDRVLATFLQWRKKDACRNWS